MSFSRVAGCLTVALCLLMNACSRTDLALVPAFTIEDLATDMTPVSQEPMNSSGTRIIYVFRQADFANSAGPLSRMLAGAASVRVTENVTLTKSGEAYTYYDDSNKIRCIVSVHEVEPESVVKVVLRWL